MGKELQEAVGERKVNMSVSERRRQEYNEGRVRKVMYLLSVELVKENTELKVIRGSEELLQDEGARVVGGEDQLLALDFSINVLQEELLF